MKKKHLPLFLMCLPGLSVAATVTPPMPVETPTLATAVISCETHYPSKEIKIIEPAVIESWATAAALQSFRFDPANIAPQLLALKPCFTDTGWQGFNDALKKSGNLEAIKSRQLTVNSQLNGKASMQTVKDNQWKITLPLQIDYQSKQEQLTQLLTVDLLVSRKASGDLGIMQLIAIPVKTAGTNGTTGAPNATTPKP